ncbi:uncharacterized protein N7484_006196 [Penicillium longicatenatum]|uniref:uncharacterized protein n=1 Tax=Penicillium longicatenatum TaxID=1561947 RepID=UPI0025485410|nr:uncharacterized protein N7484_006196 [Penicillium longicatenatum]KAJ5643689.1 hypothetical protein N7484_006196 [Penicillium longicatenatum]KAJ5644946.1 hypothetical protein N7507_010957 [Penicillium longicatenatum]
MSARFITLAKSRVATSAPSSIAIRSISSTARLQKGPVETAKDTLKKTDRMVSDAAVGGIDKGEEVAGKMKEAVGGAKEEAKTKAGDVKGNASEYEGKVKGTAEEVAGKAKGKANEAAGKAKEHLS